MDAKPLRSSLLERDRRYLRRHEVADRLGISTATLDHWVRDGRIPAIHHLCGPGKGRVVHFDWAAVCKALGVKLPR